MPGRPPSGHAPASPRPRPPATFGPPSLGLLCELGWDSVSPSAGRAPGFPRAPCSRHHPQPAGLRHRGWGAGRVCALHAATARLPAGRASLPEASLPPGHPGVCSCSQRSQPCVPAHLAAESLAGQSVTSEQRAPGTPATSGPCLGPRARKRALRRGELKAGPLCRSRCCRPPALGTGDDRLHSVPADTLRTLSEPGTDREADEAPSGEGTLTE